MNRQKEQAKPSARLSLQLLGPPRIVLDGSEIRFSRRKVLALAAYLAQSGQSHSRDELTFLLYPKQARSQAQSNFRAILSYLHKVLDSKWLVVDRSRVTLATTQHVWIDTHEFLRLLQDAQHPDAGANVQHEEQLLCDAARLYRGTFLEGFYLKDSPRFEDWLLFQQEDFQERYAFIQRRLLAIHISRGEFELALEFGRRLLRLDHLDEAVHRSMMKLYHLVGRSSAALRQYESCRNLLAEELGEAPEEETERLYAAIQCRREVPGREADQALRQFSDHMIPSNLPVDLAPFIGRKREIEEIINLLLQPEVRILTLTGTGGVGKTRLAFRVAAELRGRFEDGVFFTDLSPLGKPAEVIPAIAGKMDVRVTRGQHESLTEVLKHYLREKRVLMLLDTFEHLRESAFEVQDILDACPGCKVLVTSREVLPISGRWDYPVLPLSLPESGDEFSTERLARSESVRLLEARASAIRPDFQITTENAPAIAEICKRLDGLPLAIELAASRLRILSVQDLADRLADRINVLKYDHGGLPPRQHTMRRTIDWSYQLLSSAEKRLFTRLSVFRGGCNLEAAEEVCAELIGKPAEDVVPGLISLAEKSLVLRDEVDGETRIRMLDTILEYAGLQLRDFPEAEQIRERHALYFLDFAEKAEPHLHGPHQLEWLERLERERGNLQKASSWFLSSARAGESLRLGAALVWFWTRMGHFSEGSEQLDRALRLAGAGFDSASRADALHAVGWLLFAQGYWLRAQRCYREGLALFRSIGDRWGEGRVLSDLGLSERWLGNVENGTRHVEQAVKIAREQNDPARLARSLIWAYSTTGGQFSGEAPEAELREAWELSHSLGDLWCMAHAHQGLGDLFGARGEYVRARRHYAEALKGFRSLKDRWLTAWTFQGIGQTSYRAGDYRRAEYNLRKSLELFDLLGDRGGVIIALGTLGMVLHAGDQHQRAACILGAAARIERDLLGAKSVRRTESNVELSGMQEQYKAEREDAWARGQAMRYEQAIRYARQFPRGTSKR